MKNIMLFAGVLFTCLVFSENIFAQNIAIKRANTYYEDMAYSKAIPIYENIIKKDSLNIDVLQRLADSYYRMDEYDEAFRYYEKLVHLGQNDPVPIYRYGHLLIGKGRFTDASEWLKKYLLLKPNDHRAKIQLEKFSQIEELQKKMSTYSVHLLEGNTRFTDMCPVLYNDKLVFASSRDTFSVSMRKHAWNNQPFLDLYISTEENSLKNAVKFSDNLNTPYHEGPICFSQDGSTAYFTRNNFIHGKAGGAPEGVNNLKLFIAKFDGKGWRQVAEFPYNSNEYSVGHATLSADGQSIYFASNMPGGYGDTDIYRSVLVDGQWSEPENLGTTVNTEGREMFPYVDKNGLLYFASDGLAGLGGLDIYAAIENSDGSFLPVNLGAPINSGYDDFAYVLNLNDDMSGYFTSNRPGGMGDDDIYSFSIENVLLDITTVSEEKNEVLLQTQVSLQTCDGKTIETKFVDDSGHVNFKVNPAKCYQLIAQKENYKEAQKEITIAPVFPGDSQHEKLILKRKQIVLIVNVKDKATSESISGSKVEITGKLESELVDCTDGSIKFIPSEKANYKFYATAKGYFGNSSVLSTLDLIPGEYNVTIELDKIEKGKTLVLKDIYYDLNKWNINTDAALELDKVVKVLKENPHIKIELSSHTDCRASAKYNQELSQRRAESAANYLIRQGINRDRLVVKGYGETRLLNKCADGVPCSEEEHQANRRTELKVLN